MNVKIKQGNKTETFKLISSWEDVTLEKWLKLIDLETGSQSQEAEETIVALSDIPRKLVKDLAITDVAAIMSRVSVLQSNQSNELQRVVTINEIEYGFHPNLEEITLGEYADIETFIKNGIESNLPELMAVLYRPITEKKNDIYTIEAYNGDIRIRTEEMKQMSAEQVQNALVFFYHLGKILSEILPSYLTEKLQEMKTQ